MGRETGRHRAGVVMIWVVVALLGLASWPAPRLEAAPAAQLRDDDLTIVVLREGADPVAAARKLGVEPVYIYRQVFSGFAAKLPAASLSAAADDNLIDLLTPDQPVRRQGQAVPTGVRRIVAPAAVSAAPVVIEAGVAVLDTGIARKQSPPGKGKRDRRARDLNVRGGTTCIGKGSPYEDGDGHGTHVAGTVGARDNGYGVVGVAPGVRLYAVKVLNERGVGSTATIICGLNWVFKHRGVIDVANLSLGAPGKTSTCADNAFHRAVCTLVNEGGVAVVVASGNEGRPAANSIPANFAEAITVSAFGDTNGAPGGGGGSCEGTRDDTYARFSNYGDVVDITAPGVCIRSTKATGGTVAYSGTSMATPHVAGALALYFADNPTASVSAARTWLLNDAAVAQTAADGLIPGGRGRSSEPVLDLRDEP